MGIYTNVYIYPHTSERITRLTPPNFSLEVMRYTYDPNGTAYHLQGRKHTCPSCGKHTLQLYVGRDSGEPINEQVGKCDRHYNCGYDYPPKAYYQDHPEELPPAKDGRRYARHAQEPQKPPVIIPKEYLVKSIIPKAEKGLCAFTDILLQMFAPSDVKRIIDTYYLGRTKQGAVIFWQIDTKGLIREGKAMQYNTHTGGRDKASWATGESYWIFSTLQARKALPTPASSTKCMFGEHLLKDADYNTNVMITESEKNAIFGALAFPQFTWVAVGSSQDIGKIWKVKDILAKCRSVVVIPDADALQDWKEHVKRLNLTAQVSNLCAGHAGGWDLADIIRDRFMQHPQIFTPSLTKFLPRSEENAHASVEATSERKCRIIRISLFPDSYDYLCTFKNLQLPPDFFTERQEAVVF